MQRSMRFWNTGLALILVTSFILGGCLTTPTEKTSPVPPTQASASPAPAEATQEKAPTPVIKIDQNTPLPPRVIAQSPSAGEELPLDGSILVTFDQPMQPEKTESAWSITRLGGEAIPGQITWPQPDTLAFKAGMPLQINSTYVVKIAKSAAGTAGEAMKEDYSFQVKTVGELYVTEVFPQAGATEVENRADITVMFNRPVVPLNTAGETQNFTLPLEINPPTNGKGEWLNTSVYVFHPDAPLKGSTIYNTRLKAGVMDISGSGLVTDFVWQFTTTAPSIDQFQLPDLAINPDKNYADVPLDQKFLILFRQPMDKPSTEAAFSLTSAQGEKVAVNLTWPKPESLAIQPAANLTLGTKYRLTLDKSALAAGGGELKEGLDWNFTTYLPPAVKSTIPANGTSQKNYSNWLRVQFVSPMNLDSLKDKIVIKPEISLKTNISYDQWTWSVNIYGLKPSTHYEVSVLPGTRDIYGNEITRPYKSSFTTTSLQPTAYLELPEAAPIFRVGYSPMKFYARYVNVKTVSFGLYRLTEKEFFDLVSGKQGNFIPNSDALLRAWQAQNAGNRDQYQLTGFELQDKDGQPLPVGFYYLTMDSPQLKHESPFASERFFMVADANLTLKSTYTPMSVNDVELSGGTHVSESLVWMTDLTSGAPVPNSPVSLYDGNLTLLAKGTTDANGLASFRMGNDQPLRPDDEERWRKAVRIVMTDAGSGHFGFASSDWGSGVSPYDFGIWSDFYQTPDKLNAYLYTDRPIYRPGQPVYFKGIVRWDDDATYSMASLKSVRIKINSFDETVYDEITSLNPFGTFSGEFKLDQGAALGQYTLEAFVPQSDQKKSTDSSGNPGWIGGVSFSVADYHKPEFQVTVATDKPAVIKGEKFNASVATEYYSGGTAANAAVKWSLASQNTYFSPPDEYSDFSYSNDEEDAGMQEQRQNYDVIASGETQTGADGKLAIPLTADLSKYTISQKLTFEATVTDQTGNEVSGRTDLTAHIARFYPGVRAEEYIGKSGDPSNVELVVLDWQGKPVPGRALQVDVFERRWSSVQEQSPDGSIEWKSAVENIPVKSFTDIKTGDDGKAKITFTPKKGGIYRALVSLNDDEGNQTKASAFIWVAGDEFIPWRQSNNRSIEVIADRKEYSVGDTAEIMIASPYEGENYALVTVERGRVRSKEVILLKNNSTIYRLPVDESMVPNVYVSVIIIKGARADGASIADNPQSKPLGSGPDFRMGIKEIKVNPKIKALDVQVKPDKENAGPGEAVTYSVKTSDNQGAPVSAEVSLALSDLATLSLVEPNTQPILDFFYAQRSLGVKTAIPIVYSIESFNAALQDLITDGRAGGGGGGGTKGGENILGVAEVRQNFPDTAFWKADLVTDTQGQGKVTLTLPDNLTTWRMDARALTADTRVGQVTEDLRSTKPLLVMPQTPRFLVADDKVSLGASIHNNTSEDLDLTYSLQGTGVEILDTPKSEVHIAAGAQAYVSWNAHVKVDATNADLVFSAKSGKYEDASRPTIGSAATGQNGGAEGLPVYRYEVMETVGTSGVVASEGTEQVSTRTEAILLPKAATGAAGKLSGELRVQLSPTLAGSMTAGLDYLKSYPYECTEQTVSRFLPNILTFKTLKSLGIKNAALESNLTEQVNVALQRLYNQEYSDGGWGWWSGDGKADLLTSTYVVYGLVEAKDAGYTINADVLKRGLDYLSQNLIFVENLSSVNDLNLQSFVLYVLARAGKPAVSNTVQLYDVRQSMSLYGRAYLAQALAIIDEQDPRLKTLRSDFMDAAILSATGAHWEESQVDYFNWNTDLRTTAIVLAAMIKIDPQNELNANAVRWLMSSRQEGHWATTQETAWTLIGLTDWMVQTKELQAAYSYTALVNGQGMGDGSWQTVNAQEMLASGDWQKGAELSLDVAKMLAGQANRLTIARTQGTGNLYYSAFLNVALQVEDVQALERGIVISRNYYRPGDSTRVPIRQIQRGETFLARLTVVAPNDLHYVVIDDPLPAGVEAFDQSLLTSAKVNAPEAEAPTRTQGETRTSLDDIFEKGWGWQFFDHVELRDEKIVLSASYLPAGTYTYTYLVRASSSGEFRVIPPTAKEFYFPEVYGRGAGSLFTVLEK